MQKRKNFRDGNKTAADEAAAFLVSPKGAEKKVFDMDYGPLRIMFLGMKK